MNHVTFYELKNLVQSLENSTDLFILHKQLVCALAGQNSSLYSHQKVEYAVEEKPFHPNELTFQNGRGELIVWPDETRQRTDENTHIVATLQIIKVPTSFVLPLLIKALKYKMISYEDFQYNEKMLLQPVGLWIAEVIGWDGEGQPIYEKE